MFRTRRRAQKVKGKPSLIPIFPPKRTTMMTISVILWRMPHYGRIRRKLPQGKVVASHGGMGIILIRSCCVKESQSMRIKCFMGRELVHIVNEGTIHLRPPLKIAEAGAPSWRIMRKRKGLPK